MGESIKQKSFRLEPEAWSALADIQAAGHGDSDTAALRWLLQQVPQLLGSEDGEDVAQQPSSELLAAKDAHIASLEQALAQSQKLADQAQQQVAIAMAKMQPALPPSEAEPMAAKPAKAGKRKRKKRAK